MKTDEKFETSAYFLTTALRQLGYTNYTAIADIIDNSIEREVCSKNVFIELVKSEKERDSVSEILISDDGCGMNRDTLRSAMRLGAETGKNTKDNLGVYGAGLKTAAISIGKCLTVYTKTDNGDLLKAVLDLDLIEKTNNAIYSIESFSENTDAYKYFYEHTKAPHGTIVSISKLDNIQNKSCRGFAETLSKKIRIIFNKFIDSGSCSFYVNGEKLSYFDTIGVKSGMCTQPLDEGYFDYNNTTIVWKAWYIPKTVQNADFDDAFGRTNANAGIYVYRQWRLVGYGLDLGICHKSSQWTNGFRFELFIDGTADKLFGTTFTKMITEKERNEIEVGFYEELKRVAGPFVNQSIRMQKNETDDEKVTDDMKKSLDRTAELLNKNVLLANTVHQKGTNEKNKNSKPKNPNPKPQENPNPTRKRTGDWFGGFEFVGDGETGFMFDVRKKDGKSIVLINQDHAFFEHIFKKLDADGRNNMAIFLACEASAMQNSDYYIDDYAEKYINSYKSCYGDAVRRAFI